MCKIYNPNRPEYGNGEINNDADEDCNNSAIDL
jgi:hypothetical protein